MIVFIVSICVIKRRRSKNAYRSSVEDFEDEDDDCYYDVASIHTRKSNISSNSNQNPRQINRNQVTTNATLQEGEEVITKSNNPYYGDDIRISNGNFDVVQQNENPYYYSRKTGVRRF